MSSARIRIDIPDLGLHTHRNLKDELEVFLAKICVKDAEIAFESTAYKLFIEMEYADGGTRLDYLLFASLEELEAAEKELEGAFGTTGEVDVYRSHPLKVIPQNESDSQIHSGPLLDVDFIKEMREYLGLDEEDEDE